MALSLTRTLDPRFLNEVANHPEVRPMLGGKGELDLASLIANPANYAFVTRGGGWLGVQHEPGIYEVHSLFLPEGRGSHLPGLTEELARYMFTATDCMEVQTRCPANNRPAWALAAAAGFKETFTRKAAWADEDGALHDVSYRVLTFDAWKARDKEIAALGHEFHEKLEVAKREAGSSLATHPDDEAHDRAVGAAVMMLRAGNGQKAVWLYNRWARLAGYATISLLSQTPPVIDVVDAVVGLEGNDMQVLLCR